MTNAATPDPAELSRRARDLVHSGRAEAARPLVAALRRLSADPREVAELETDILAAGGHIAEALTGLDDALCMFPGDPMLLMRRARLRLESGDIYGGADDAAACVMAQPAHPIAKAMLGIALIKLDRADEAETCLAEAVRDNPHLPGFYHALAEAQELAGRVGVAAATLADAAERWPGRVALRTAAIMLEIRRRNNLRAVALAREAQRDGVADATVFSLLGHALSIVGDHDQAAGAYREALKLNPEDPYVRHLVHANGPIAGAARAPGKYVATVFNGYADRFEPHLISLGYRVPGLMRCAVQTHCHSGDTIGDILDIGCGTGFVGLVLSDLPHRLLVGVDISSAMLDVARDKAIYDELIEADIETFIPTDSRTWDLVTAGDVLNYLGDLGPIFAATRARLRPRGHFVLTLEARAAGSGPESADPASADPASADPASADPESAGAKSHVARSPGAESAEPWLLLRQGRFAHTESYVRAAAEQTGLAVRELRGTTLRLEAGAPVDGMLVVLARADH